MKSQSFFLGISRCWTMHYTERHSWSQFYCIFNMLRKDLGVSLLTLSNASGLSISNYYGLGRVVNISMKTAQTLVTALHPLLGVDIEISKTGVCFRFKTISE